MSTPRTQIEGAAALVTGGNRGFGRALVDELLARGAAKVYATSRTPHPTRDERIIPLVLDVTDDESVAAAANDAPNVSIVVNNAGAVPADERPGLAGRGPPQRARDEPVRDDPRRAGIRARVGPPRLKRAHQRPVGAVLVRDGRRLRGLQGSRFVGHQLDAHATARTGDDRHRGTRRLHGHRHGRRPRRPRPIRET